MKTTIFKIFLVTALIFSYSIAFSSGEPHSVKAEIKSNPLITVTRYVNSARLDNSGDGLSWSTAYRDLQNAIDAAQVGDEIWVAAGTYTPTTDHTGNASPTNNHNKNFHISQDVKIYGGFVGTENQLNQRDFANNKTILSGDFLGDDVVTGNGISLSITGNTENAYHVLIAANLTSASKIDGFTIKGGYAVEPEFWNNIIFQDYLYNNINGGGMYLVHSSPKIANCIFTGNQANTGAMIFNSKSSSEVWNSVFTKNLCERAGNYNEGSYTKYINTTFFGNKTTTLNESGCIHAFSKEKVTVRNSIFWENAIVGSYAAQGADIAGYQVDVAYCLTQQGSYYQYGTGVINNIDPLFVDAANGDLRLQCESPLIDAGDSLAWDSTGLSLDLAGKLRPFHSGIVDIGAYEFYDLAYPSPRYVKHDATGANDGTSWANAYTDLQDAIDNKQCGNYPIWVAAGTYHPTKDHLGNLTPENPRTKNFHFGNPYMDEPLSENFHFPVNMEIYGGFIGNETELHQRDWLTNKTILSGDFMENDTISGIGSTLSITGNNENAYHVLVTHYLNNTSKIDGFFIEGGNANSNENFNYLGRDLTNNFGGGIHNFDTNLTMCNLVMQENSSNSLGGALHNSNSTSAFTNITFYKNLSKHYGGAVYNSTTTSKFINCSFIGNRTIGSDKRGGAVFNASATPSFINTLFSENASDEGGAMYNINSTFGITGCTFTNNVAFTNGGAIYNDTSSPIITNSTFSGNFANGNGGGMFNFNNATPIVTNSVFFENIAFFRGGAIYNEYATNTIFNSTFYSNSASLGGGLYSISYSPSTVRNSIFWGNLSSGQPQSFVNQSNSTLNISHSLVSEADSASLSTNANGGVINNGNMIYNQDPLFIDAVNGNFKLNCYSPAVNQGTLTNAPLDDYSGLTRIGNPDLGAYEYGYKFITDEITAGTNPTITGTPIIIGSSHIQNTNNVLYQGSNNVLLLPGFSVAPTAGAATVFRAEIGGGCL